MKSLLILLLISLIAPSINAQTEKELIGKWKLVKLTKNGQEKNIKEEFNTDQVYQIFEEDNTFIGTVGSKNAKGKWSLKDENKTLQIKSGISKVNFTVDYFDAKKRIISSDKMGTLEYAKVE